MVKKSDAVLLKRMKSALIDAFAREFDSYKDGVACAKQVATAVKNKFPEDVDARLEYYSQVIRHMKGESDDLKEVNMKVDPVPPEVFFTDPYFTNDWDSIYPEVLKSLCEMNSGKYEEIVLTGSIGAAKTTCAILCQQYQLYILSCMDSPHEVFRLNPNHEIEIIFQSLKEKHAKEIGYDRFLHAINQSRYFQEYFPNNPNVKSKLVFPNRIEVKYVSGAQTATLGHNVIGGVLDEVNFMAVIEDSKNAADGDVYDQAIALYNSIVRRRKSRFLKGGKQLPGLLCLVSSKKYPGQFTDMKVAEAQYNSKIYVYDRVTWEINPDDFADSDWFHVFIGTDTRKPKLLKEGEKVPDKDKEYIRPVPMEYYDDFVRDIYSSLRDILGVSTKAKNPFIPNSNLVAKCFGKAKSVLNVEHTDFKSPPPLKLLKKNIETNTFPRFVHIDYGLTGDSCGLACGYIEGFHTVKRRDSTEMLPKIVFDFILSIDPPEGDEIIFSKVRNLIYKMRDKAGLPIKWVTMDSWQSVDSIQILRGNGFVTGKQSIDVSMLPYDVAKTAFYDQRVRCPKHETVFNELTSLEIDNKKGKVDHPPNGSKDCSDAVAGVIYGLTMMMEIWTMFNISPSQIPPAIVAAAEAHSSVGKEDSVKSVGGN